MCLNCIFILAILFSSLKLGENVLRQSLQDTAKVIISLQRLYQTNCLFLIAVSLKREQDTCEQRVLTDLGKHLSKKKAPNLIVPAIKYNYSMPSYRCSRNRPLNIILTTNTTNSTALNQVSNFKGPVWVAFVEPTMDAEELVEDVYVPMNTEFLIARNTDNEGIVMVEAYNIIPKTPKRWNFFGNWTSEKGLLLNKASLFDRRSDLQGVTFHAVSTNNPPITKVKINGSSMHVEGFVGRVWKIMEKSLNFSTTFHPAIDKTDKGQEYDGKWTAMVNKVADMNFEMGVDALAMTSDRAAKIDYTLPLMTAKYRVFIRKPDKQEVEWTTFLTPFSTAIWLTTLASILATALGIDLTQRFRRMYNRFDETEEDESFSLKNSLFYVFGLLCQQGTDVVPNNYSSRMAYSTACMVAVVLLANYSATLISYLTIRTDKLPFKDLKGLLASGIYTFGTSNNSAQYSYFKDSNDTFVKKLYEKAMAPDPANLPNSKIEGLQRVCNKHYGFLTNYDTAIASRKQISCEIVPLPNEEMDTSLSLILTKDSPYRRYFNHKLLKMREAGLLDKEYHDIMDETKDEFPTTSSVTLEDVTPILSLLAVGIGIAVFVLVVEKYHAKANANHERPSLSSSVSTRSSNWSGSQHGKRKRRFVKPRLTNSSKNLYYTYKKPFKFYPRISTEIFLRMNQWKSRMFKKLCNEKVLNVTFIFIIIWSTSESFYFYTGLDFQYPLQNTANIVTSIQKLYHSNCIFLISLFPESDPDQEELLMLTELGKILSKHSASNAIVHAEDYNYSLPSFRCPRNRPLNVMLATNRTNRTSFTKIIDVKGPVWMLYTGARTIIDNLLSEFYIPISVEFLIAQTLPNETVLLSEVYRIDYSTPLLKNLVGDWNDKRGLNTTKLSFFKRRQNFHGVTLMAVTTSNPPFTYLYGNTSNLTIDGFVGKVWKTIETGFNFSTTFHISLDSMGHNRKVDGKWSAMIDAVASSVVQFGVDAFTMTSARARVVDFTWPLISTKYKVYIRKPNQQAVDWNTFLTPLSKGIWITTGVFVVVVAIGLHVTQQLRRIFISFTASQEDPGSFSFDNSLFYVYGLLCQQGSDIMPRSLPCRIAFSTACIIAVVLLANYSATLISFLAVRIEKLPFLDLEGLLHDGSYQFGTVNRSAYYYYYTESNDTFRSTLYWKTMVKDRKNFPSNNLEGLKRVCEINFGFLTTTDTAEILKKNLSCEIVYLPKERFDASLGIILTKGSPYRRLINHRLLSMHEGGLLKQQYRTIMDPTHNENSDTISVTIVDVAPILILLATGIALASLILLMEICFSKSGSPSPVFRDSVPRRQQRSTLFQKRRKLGVRQRRSNVSKPFYYYYKKPFQFSPRITVQMYRTHFNQFH